MLRHVQGIAVAHIDWMVSIVEMVLGKDALDYCTQSLISLCWPSASANIFQWQIACLSALLGAFKLLQFMSPRSLCLIGD